MRTQSKRKLRKSTTISYNGANRVETEIAKNTTIFFDVLKIVLSSTATVYRAAGGVSDNNAYAAAP